MTQKIDVRPWDCWTATQVQDFDTMSDGPGFTVLFRLLPDCFGGPALNGMRIPMPIGEFASRFARWAAGDTIQKAFPFSSADVREFIMTGITPEAWEKAFEPGE